MEALEANLQANMAPRLAVAVEVAVEAKEDPDPVVEGVITECLGDLE